jgi:hypothetical protein
MDPRWRPGFGYLAFALVIFAAAGIALLLYLWLRPGADDAASDTGPSATAAAGPARSAPQPAQPALPRPASAPAPRAPLGDADPTPDLRSYVARGEKPTMAEVIGRLHERGIHTGLGAFNPPGTRPPLVGLAVPEDFELPKGYVRHHQVTDDGQRIEAILMFAPDYQPLDAAGRPIPLPRDRVVPPELAPPGLPVRRIAIPPPVDPSSAGAAGR